MRLRVCPPWIVAGLALLLLLTQPSAFGQTDGTGVAYTAQYMEAVLRPGMKSLVHRHSGPEAW